MLSRVVSMKAILLLLPLLIPFHGYARQVIDSWPAVFLESPIELREGVGGVHDPVTTASDEARAYYRQGLALYYLFDYHDAVRSFHAALRYDPTLAAAHLAMNLAFERMGRGEAAQEALLKADDLAHHAGAAEQAQIALRMKFARLRAGEHSPEAYATALRDAVARFPESAELRMELTRRAGDAEVRIARLQDVLEVAPDHIGGLHKLAHQYEMMGDYHRSAELGWRIAELAPAVPHALQMAAYFLPRMGRAEEAVEWLEAADRLERRLIEESGLPPALFPNFRMNLNLLASTYWQVGRTEASERLFQEFMRLVGDPVGVTRATLVDMELIRGRTAEALTVARQLVAEAEAGRASVPMAHATLASALVAVGDLEGGRAELDAVEVPEGPFGPSVEIRVRRVEAQLLLFSGTQVEGAEALLAAAHTAASRASGLEWFRPRLELELLAATAAHRGDQELASGVGAILLEVDPSYVGAGALLDPRGG